MARQYRMKDLMRISMIMIPASQVRTLKVQGLSEPLQQNMLQFRMIKKMTAAGNGCPANLICNPAYYNEKTSQQNYFGFC